MPKVVSLFTGVGGLDFGFEAAGFETAVAVEFNAAACETLRLNRDWPLIEGDIHDVTSEAILEAGNLKVGEADVLTAGPPCQPFSKSGYWARGDSLRLDDPRADTLTAFLRVLRDIQPKTFLLENVSGLIFKGKDEGMRHLLDGIRQVNEEAGTNYQPVYRVLNAVNYGVPQSRERVFLVGSRDGRKFEFPEPTHYFDSEPIEGRKPATTAWDAIGDLDGLTPNEEGLVVNGTWGDLLPSIPEGQNYLYHTNRGGGMRLFGWRTRYWSFMLKLAKERPSWTIQAQPGSAVGPFHWKNRRLTARELCRIQTFPDDVRFNVGRTEVQRQVGNAVPSLLAEVLASAIREQFLDGHKLDDYKLSPPVRKPVPPPERVMPVPVKYHDRVGDHDDHPGEGKSRRAIERKEQQMLLDLEASVALVSASKG